MRSAAPLMLTWAMCLCSCGSEPPEAPAPDVGEDLMTQVWAEQAQASWPAFVEAFDELLPRTSYLVQVFLVDDQGEPWWVTLSVLEATASGGRGVIWGTPPLDSGLRDVEEVRFALEQVIDWWVVDPEDGVLMGGFSDADRRLMAETEG